MVLPRVPVAGERLTVAGMIVRTATRYQASSIYPRASASMRSSIRLSAGLRSTSRVSQHMRSYRLPTTSRWPVLSVTVAPSTKYSYSTLRGARSSGTPRFIRQNPPPLPPPSKSRKAREQSAEVRQVLRKDASDADGKLQRQAVDALPSAKGILPPLEGQTIDPALLVPVELPHDDRAIATKEEFPDLAQLLGQTALVVTREVEMMNIFLGFEQANRYSLMAPSGEHVGYLAEEELGILGGSIQRQLMRNHRPFRATVLSTSGKPILLIKRGFTFINSNISVYALPANWDGREENAKLVGESQQRWHAWRRKYDLFLNRPVGVSEQERGLGQPSDDRERYVGKAGGPGNAGAGSGQSFDQFARIDTGMLGWDFVMEDEQGRLVGAINRNFRGFGREIFTDTGQYVLRFEAIEQDELNNPRLHTAVDPGQALQMQEKAHAQAQLSQPLLSGEDGVKVHDRTRANAAGQAGIPSNTDLQTSEDHSNALVPPGKSRALSLDERAVALATAVSVDFDYFSRHSTGQSAGGGFFPWFGWGGGGSEEPPPPTEGGTTDGSGPGIGQGAESGASTAAGYPDVPAGPTELEADPYGIRGTSVSGPPPSSPSESTPWWEQAQPPAPGSGPESDGGGGSSGGVWGADADPWAEETGDVGGGGGEGGGFWSGLWGTSEE